ncbi:hypothetical protein [Streptomyces sp. NPDC057382]|uniref:hypothetical protein n=1 Tax=unclassified Streptomyces TaxID=2593676 RepID=UPI00363A99FB
MGELKRYLYALYIEAGPPTLDEVVTAIKDDDDLPGSPSRDTIARCLGSPQVPAQKADLVSLTAALARMADRDEAAAVAKAKELWVVSLTREVPEAAGTSVSTFTDPYALEVHRSIATSDPSKKEPSLPSYVLRKHDSQLLAVADNALHGHSRIATLVGVSSSGKTRACWELIQKSSFRGWSLWHPIDPSRPEALLDGVTRVGPNTIVWLNDAHDYLLTATSGERVAAALRSLLRDANRSPVLILATIWPEEWATLTAPRNPKITDIHPQARSLLTGSDISIPSSFDARDLSELLKVATKDSRLAEAHKNAKNARITQYLSGVPVLQERFRNAPPAARAVIEAAMDARRLGHGPIIAKEFLRTASVDYIDDGDWQLLTQGWFEDALSYSCTPCLGIPGPLSEARTNDHTSSEGATYRLADILEEQSRNTRRFILPAPSFWRAAASHARTPQDMTALGDEARARALYLASDALYETAASQGNTTALRRLAFLTTDPEAHERLLREAAALEDSFAKSDLASFLNDQERAAGEVAQLLSEAADEGVMSAITELAMRQDTTLPGFEIPGPIDESEDLTCERKSDALNALAWRQAIELQDSGRIDEAFEIFQELGENGDPYAKIEAAIHLSRSGKQAEAERLAAEAVAAGLIYAWDELLFIKLQLEDYEEAERLAFKMLEAGDFERFEEYIESIRDKLSAERVEDILRKAIYSGYAAVIYGWNSPYPGVTNWGLVAEMGIEPDGTVATKKGYGRGGDW